MFALLALAPVLLAAGELRSPAQAISPDGKQFAYAVSDGSLRLATLPWATPRWCTGGLSTEIDSIEWSPAGDRIAAIAHDARVFVLNVSDGGLLLELPAREDFVLENYKPSSIAFVHGGKSLLAVGGRSQARLYDSATGALLREFANPTLAIPTTMAVSGDGEHVALGDSGGSVAVYKVVDGALEAGPWAVPAHVNALAFDPSATHLAVGAGGHDARIYDLTKPSPPRIFSHEANDWTDDIEIGCVEFSPDGKRLLTTCFGWWEAKCWTLEPDGLAWSYDYGGSDERPMRASFGRDPALVFLEAYGRVHQAGSGALIRSFERTGRWSTSSRADYAWGQFDAAIHVVDVREGTPVCRFPLTPAPPPNSRAQAVSPDGKLFAYSLDNGTVHVVSLPDGKPIRTLAGFPKLIDDLAFSPDEKLIAGVGGDGIIRVFASADGTAAREFQAGEKYFTPEWCARRIAFVDSGKHLFVAGGGECARLLDLEAGRLLREWTLASVKKGEEAGQIVATAISEDQLHLALGDRAGRVGVFSARTGEPEFGPWQGAPDTYALAFDKDARRLAVGAGDCLVRVVTLDGHRKMIELSHCDSDLFKDLAIGCVRFSPDGKSLLASSFSFWEVRLWDLETGAKRWSFDYAGGAPGAIEVRFVGDGRFVFNTHLGGVFESSSGKQVRELEPSASNGYFPSAGDYAWCTSDSSLEIFSIPGGKRVCTIPLASP